MPAHLTRIRGPAVPRHPVRQFFGEVGFALIMVWASPSLAITPVLPPPCTDANFDSQSVDTLAAELRIDAPDAEYWAAKCASEALSRKGEEAVPALISLMESHNANTELLALSAACGDGHRGESAVPYILYRIRSTDLAFAQLAFHTLACMQEGARPAIPLLLEKSLQSIPGAPAQQGNAAIEALGELSALDPDTIIPHITKLLDSPIHTVAAAEALEKIGDPARDSLPNIRRRLDSAIKGREAAPVASLISAMTVLGSAADNIEFFISLLGQPVAGPLAAKALGNIGGEATSALPFLVRALNDPRIKSGDRYSYIAALASIAPESTSTRRMLLREATRDDGSLSFMEAASRLSEMDPLPANFAPLLAKRIESLDENDSTAYLLKKALDHTHTGLKPKPFEPPSPPEAAPPQLVQAIVSLAKQAHVVTLNEAMVTLGLNPHDYEQEQTYSARLRHPDNAGDMHMVAGIHITGVMPTFAYPPSTTPLMIQGITVDLLKRYCVAPDAISEPAPKPDPRAIYVVAHRPGGTFKFKGTSPEDVFAARENTLDLGTNCSKHVEISKSFDSDYWQRKCPFVYDGAIVKKHLIPALQSRIGSDFERYDLSRPQLKEFGRGIQLVFATPKVQTETSKDGLALRVTIDRCTREIESAWEF